MGCMENMMESAEKDEEELRTEAKLVLDMVDGFGLLREGAQESDKEAFINAYIEFYRESSHLSNRQS